MFTHGCEITDMPRPDKSDPEAVAVVSSAHLNATGIALSLREIGWRGRIACLCINGSSSLASRWPHVCEVWHVRLGTPADLLPCLSERLCPRDLRLFLFTDEKFLPLFRTARPREIFANLRYHLGSVRFLETILDRQCLYRFVAAGKLAEVPRTVSSDVDPWREFGPACFTRLWSSWDGVRKLGHGMMLRDHGDLERWREHCRRLGLRDSQWGFQELLSTRPRHNLSVCGWHEPGLHHYRTLRRVFPFRGLAGPVFEAVADPAGLSATAQAVLDALAYTGPFEMEFVLDPRSGRYKMNELNPRFWAQHRLLAAASDNWLVRRYLGEEITQVPEARPRHRFWLNTDEFLPMLLRGSWAQTVPYLRKACWSHPLRGSWSVAARRAWHEVW